MNTLYRQRKGRAFLAESLQQLSLFEILLDELIEFIVPIVLWP